ncbi:MAG: HDOD domain-containing protein [Gemmatimonadota bacterium]|nr:HDOD domain-containing protein [Gemmatimonadota bacterium]
MAKTPESLVRNSTVSSPPDVYAKLMEVINHPRSGANDVAKVLASDPGLAARLLRIVNSAFFGFPRRIESMGQAVTLVGTGQIRDLALATSVIRAFDGVPDDMIDVRDFWSYSLATGVVARLFGARTHADNVERFFLAGVLHSVGRLLILLKAPTEARAAFDKARESTVFLHEAEREVLGFDHAAVGAALVEAWNLPPAFGEAVRYQYQPQRASSYPHEAAAVHLATVVATGLEWGSAGETLVLGFESAAWDALGLDLEILPGLLDDAERQYQAAVQAVAGALA